MTANRLSDVHRALLPPVSPGSRGDVVTLRTPRGTEELEIVDIRYDPLP